MESIANQIAAQFNNDGSQFFIETHDNEIEIIDICNETCSSMDKGSNYTIYNFIDDSKILICESFWTNKQNEIQEFLDFIDETYEQLSMESLNLSWSNFL